MSPSRQHVELPVSPVAGVKRPAPSLLPAFEPSSSSPQLPRPTKRPTHASPSKSANRGRFYPTPVPTSSTLMPSSSPPKATHTRRLGLKRTLSTFSERAPLATVPTVELSEHEPILMGRSSNSSHYQLSTNKLISRVHVRAVYIAANPPDPKKVQVECMGWNGVKVHCQGKAWELMKGDTFTSETEDADIMVDVHDARVLLAWPKSVESKLATPTDSDSTWDSENSPSRGGAAARTRAPHTSPLRQQQRLQSPVSPSPAMHATNAAPPGYLGSDPPVIAPVQIYEDEPVDVEIDEEGSQKATQATQVLSQPFKDVLQELQSSPLQYFSDNDEENDPIITSFGPFGANLHARMESFTTYASPKRRALDPLKEESISPQRGPRSGGRSKCRRHSHDADVSESFQEGEQKDPITNHVINQLAYSRLSSTPLSTLKQNLPAHMTAQILQNSSPKNGGTSEFSTTQHLKSILENTGCIGIVEREGKDAAGKRLESEYYYIPEGDADEARREMVEGLGGRGLRNCRKSHKVGQQAPLLC